jgi:hypothetical protein
VQQHQQQQQPGLHWAELASGSSLRRAAAAAAAMGMASPQRQRQVFIFTNNINMTILMRLYAAVKPQDTPILLQTYSLYRGIAAMATA